MEACYSGPDGTQGVGICKEGTRTCTDATWGPCEGDVVPANEDCSDPRDEDCNGLSCSETLWSKIYGDVSAQRVSAVAVDSDGSIYVGGGFEGTIDLGGGPLVSGGGEDVFIAKLDPAGGHVWSKRFGGGNNQYIDDVAVTPDGVALVGTFFPSITFGGATHTADTTNSYQSTFVAELDKSRAFVWSADLDETAGYTSKVGADPSGNVVMAVTLLDPAKSTQVHVEQYSAQGVQAWSKSFGDNSDQEVADVAVDSSGNVLLAGYFFGTMTIGNISLISAGASDVFVAKLDSSGNYAWSNHFGDSDTQRAVAVALDASGNAAVLGIFRGTVDFGNGPLTAVGMGGDVFLVKLSSGGTTLWSKAFTSTEGMSGDAVTFDADGNVILAGTFSGTTNFGADDLVGAGMYLVKLDPSGKQVWAKQHTGVVPAALATSASNEIVCGGSGFGTVDFGAGMLTSAGDDDAFVGKVAP